MNRIETRIDIEEFRRLWRAGEKVADIAAKLNCHKKSIRLLCKRLGEENRDRRGVTVDREAFTRAWLDDVPGEDMMEQFGIEAYSTLWKFCKRFGLPKRHGNRFVDPPAPTPEEIQERAAYCRMMRAAGTPVGGA